MTEKRQTSQGYIIRIFATFRNETLEYYKFCDALSSCDEIFIYTCWDQNFAYNANAPLKYVFQP
jgi:ribosomal protein L20